MGYLIECRFFEIIKLIILNTSIFFDIYVVPIVFFGV